MLPELDATFLRHAREFLEIFFRADGLFFVFGARFLYASRIYDSMKRKNKAFCFFYCAQEVAF